MSDFVSDPDYALRWPPDLFQEEVERLVRQARMHGASKDWQGEVEHLLRQAFSSAVPLRDFERAVEQAADPDKPIWVDADEPF